MADRHGEAPASEHEAALELLRPLLDSPSDAALLLDFDGTLAPIVEDPPAARALPAVAPTLKVLARVFRRVAVVSGRPIEFLCQVLPEVRGVELVGQYGLQRLVEGEIVVNARVQPFLPQVEQLAEEADRLLPEVFVERKEGISVTLHWRRAPASEERCLRAAKRLGAKYGFLLLHGRMAVELRPPVPLDKGVVASELVADVDAAAYFGDDVGDLPAFEALHGLRAGGALRCAVCVGVTGDDTPPELSRATDTQVRGPHAVAALLEAIVAILDGA